MTTPLYLLQLENRPIFEQLQLEEALLRTREENFCLINRGSPRSIVMGISGKPEQLVDLSRVNQDQIPLIQRFSGGGTVIVDEETLFVSFIFSKNTLPIHPFPEPILRWTAALYASAWKLTDFQLCENDYTIGPRKCGGNAQYIQKNRWLHHTTFLWDYRESNMDYLLHPPKQPLYRQSRSHRDFLCKLKDHAPSKEFLIEELLRALSTVKPFYLEPVRAGDFSFAPHRKATKVVEKD